MKYNVDVDLRIVGIEADDEIEAMDKVQDELAKMGIEYIVTREDLSDEC
jgi:hypothetical protein